MNFHTMLIVFTENTSLADLLVTIINMYWLVLFHWLLMVVSSVKYPITGDFCLMSLQQLLQMLSDACSSLSNVLIQKIPLRAFQFSDYTSHLAACCLLVYSVIFPLTAVFEDRSVDFCYTICKCDSSGSYNIWTTAGRSRNYVWSIHCSPLQQRQ